MALQDSLSLEEKKEIIEGLEEGSFDSPREVDFIKAVRKFLLLGE